MSARRPAAKNLPLIAGLLAVAALAVSPPFAAADHGGGGCAPLATIVKLVHRESGNTGIEVRATIRNCARVPEPMQLDVSVPDSKTVPFKFSTGGAAPQPGQSLTMGASPTGSTPVQLHFSQTYNVVATLTQTGPTPITLATISTPVTMPPGLVP